MKLKNKYDILVVYNFLLMSSQTDKENKQNILEFLKPLLFMKLDKTLRIFLAKENT